MANGKFVISRQADDRLLELMVHLEINRPLALQIALSKGLLQEETYRPDPIAERGREIPDRVVWSGPEYVLFSHLIREKEQARITSGKEMDERFRFYIEKGLEIVKNEIEHLPSAGNYLLTLLGQSESPTDENKHIKSSEDEIEVLAELLHL